MSANQAHNRQVGSAHECTSLLGSTCSKSGTHSLPKMECPITIFANKDENGQLCKSMLLDRERILIQEISKEDASDGKHN